MTELALPGLRAARTPRWLGPLLVAAASLVALYGVWLLYISGQLLLAALRAVAPAGTDLGTPWAEKTTGAAVSGISSSSSTNTAPYCFSPSTTYLLWTMACRT